MSKPRCYCLTEHQCKGWDCIECNGCVHQGQKNLVYLAVPYSHPDERVRQERYEAVTKAAGFLMNEGYIVFSPITHCHHIKQICDLPTGWEYWEAFDRAYLKHCSKLIVLKLHGWEDSVGVNAEIDIAKEMGIEIEYMDLV